MKKTLYIIMVALAALSLSSCKKFLDVQPEGSKVMTASQMLCGRKIEVGKKVN